MMPTFAEFKALCLKKRIAPQAVETQNAVELTLTENGVKWVCFVFKPDDVLYNEAEYNDYVASRELIRLDEAVERRSEDGKLQTQPLMLDTNLWHRYTSYGDSDTTIGEGIPARALVRPGDPNRIVNISFRDWFQVFGGIMKYDGGEITDTDGDWISFRVIVPNNESVTVSPDMTGNVMVWNGTVIPMPGGTGGVWNVDLTKANLIPAPKKSGFWNWSWPDTGRGEITPALGQTGEFHIITPTYATVEFIGKNFMLGSGSKTFTPPNPKPTYMYPGWLLQAEIHKCVDGEKPLSVIWEFQTARRATI